jgi:hypothetical protein
MLRPHRLLALAGALLPLAVASARDVAPTEYLDETTGATVTVVNKPLVFARERSEHAANLRDYINLTAASVNRGGKTEYVLIAYVWSTLDPRYAAAGGSQALVLRADDRRIELNANGKQPSDLGIGESVHAPPGQESKPLVYPIDLPTLRFIGAARSLTVQAVGEEDSFDYELWDDQRAALGRFAAFLNGAR